MKYINQLLYENVPYPTDAKNPDSPMLSGSIKRAGCGLCCLCMVVDRLTTQSLPLEECRDLAIMHKANLDPGTDLKVLSPVIAQKYSLKYSSTNGFSRDDPLPAKRRLCNRQRRRRPG